jgi:hypothetical protein
MEELLRDVEHVNSSLTRGGFQAAAKEGTTSAIGEQTRAANQRIDSSASKGAAQMPGAKTDAQPAQTVLLRSLPSTPAASPVGAAPTAKPGARRLVKNILTQPDRPTSRPGRTALAACAILAIIAFGALAVVRRDEVLAMAAHRAWAKIVNLASRGPATHALTLATPNTPTMTTATSAEAQTSPTADVETTAAASEPILTPAPSSLPSLEDQQHYLIGLAQQAADRQDYKGAQEQLDEAAKLNGPLNDLVADLRRQFSAQSHSVELERTAREEQALWDKAMAYLEAGDLDDADESLRDILTSPEGSHRWSAAAHYVDQVIPERRQEEQLWAVAQRESRSQDPGHLSRAIEALDDVLAAGGTHQQGARQKRDAMMSEIIRSDTGTNGISAPVVSNADQWELTRTKNHFDDLVQKGDAAALEEFQQLRSRFQSLADAQGPLALDARDYLKNVIPKAQRRIEDRLAVAESNSSANAAYASAVKEYNSAVAGQNAAMLRDKVLPVFRQIAQSGGVRAKEAQRYADVLIPAALKKLGQ